MPLSEHEQRMLEQMERALYAEDPKFASALDAGGLRTYTRRRVYQAIAGFVVGIVLSMGLLAYALKCLPVGTAYAIWTGTGAVGTALISIAIFGESAAWGRIAAIMLIAVGIVWLATSEA